MAKLFPDKTDAKVEQTPLVVDAKETPPAELAVLDAETSLFNARIDALTARIEQLSKKHDEELEALELKVASAKRDEAEAKLAKANESLDRLERSYGISAAKVVAMTPMTTGQRTVIDVYNEMPDGAEKSSFYNEHREVLIKFANKPTKAA